MSLSHVPSVYIQKLLEKALEGAPPSHCSEGEAGQHVKQWGGDLEDDHRDGQLECFP